MIHSAVFGHSWPSWNTLKSTIAGWAQTIKKRLLGLGTMAGRFQLSVCGLILVIACVCTYFKEGCEHLVQLLDQLIVPNYEETPHFLLKTLLLISAMNLGYCIDWYTLRWTKSAQQIEKSKTQGLSYKAVYHLIHQYLFAFMLVMLFGFGPVITGRTKGWSYLRNIYLCVFLFSIVQKKKNDQHRFVWLTLILWLLNPYLLKACTLGLVDLTINSGLLDRYIINDNFKRLFLFSQLLQGLGPSPMVYISYWHAVPKAMLSVAGLLGIEWGPSVWSKCIIGQTSKILNQLCIVVGLTIGVLVAKNKKDFNLESYRAPWGRQNGSRLCRLLYGVYDWLDVKAHGVLYLVLVSGGLELLCAWFKSQYAVCLLLQLHYMLVGLNMILVPGYLHNLFLVLLDPVDQEKSKALTRIVPHSNTYTKSIWYTAATIWIAYLLILGPFTVYHFSSAYSAFWLIFLLNYYFAVGVLINYSCRLFCRVVLYCYLHYIKHDKRPLINEKPLFSTQHNAAFVHHLYMDSVFFWESTVVKIMQCLWTLYMLLISCQRHQYLLTWPRAISVFPAGWFIPLCIAVIYTMWCINLAFYINKKYNPDAEQMKEASVINKTEA